MSRSVSLVAVLALLATSAIAQQGSQQSAQEIGQFDTPAQTRAALKSAHAQAADAEMRSKRLEMQARRATRSADKTAREAAALAARIQQAEAGIAAAEAQISLIDGQRAALDNRLAQKREPLIRLTASLQKMARRPLALSALRPGSLQDTVYLRAMLGATLPQVRARTAGLRAEIERARRLEQGARAALAAMQENESVLASRKQSLAALETKQRIASRRASGDANREVERALALAEEARDLDSLARTLDAASALRKQLAALPGPIMRPDRPQASEVMAATQPVNAPPTTAPRQFQLPVNGRTVAGFGAPGDGGIASNGISLASRSGAQVVSPATGRVVFAGAYKGYGRIVIIEHPGGWTSLVTGLARNDVEVGEGVVGGSPLGVAGAGRPIITLELRRNGEPVNPVDYLR